MLHLVHCMIRRSLKTKSSGIILTSRVVFVPIFYYLWYLRYGAKKLLIFRFFGLFCDFFANFSEIKKLFPKL